MRWRYLPLVKVQQLSRFLAFDLGLHHIPVFIIHTPPCCWVLTDKQSTHGSRELTPSPSNSDKSFQQALFYRKGIKHVLFPQCLALSQQIPRSPSTDTQTKTKQNQLIADNLQNLNCTRVTMLPSWHTEFPRDDTTTYYFRYRSSEQHFLKVCPLEYFVICFTYKLLPSMIHFS